MSYYHESGFENNTNNSINNDALTNEKSKIDPPPLSPPPTHKKRMFAWVREGFSEEARVHFMGMANGMLLSVVLYELAIIFGFMKC